MENALIKLGLAGVVFVITVYGLIKATTYSPPDRTEEEFVDRVGCGCGCALFMLCIASILVMIYYMAVVLSKIE